MKTEMNFQKNIFLSVTENSKKRMQSIASSHTAALEAEKADADLLVLFNRTKPLTTVFNNDFAKWLSACAFQKSETERFKNLLEEIPQKLREWNVPIQQVFLEKTFDYIFLFPKGKGVFYKGTYEQRITELNSFVDRLNKYPQLSDVKDLVSAFCQFAENSRLSQQKSSDLLKQSSLILEDKRIELSYMFYANLGMLMNKYAHNTEQISRFFDPKLLSRYNHKDEEGTDTYEISLAPNSKKEAGIQFGVGATLLFFNNSNIPLEIYTAPDKTSPAPEQPIIIEPNSEKSYMINELGALGNRFLYIENKDLHEEGEIEITLIKI